MAINVTVIQQTLLNTFAGIGISSVAGALGTNVVRYLNGRSTEIPLPSGHPLWKGVALATVIAPIWYLYKRYGEKHTAYALRPAAFEIISLMTALGILKHTEAKVTPLLSLTLVLTHLSWKIFASTTIGRDLLKV